MSRSTPGKDTRCESKTEALVAASWQLFANTYAHGCHERIDGALVDSGKQKSKQYSASQSDEFIPQIQTFASNPRLTTSSTKSEI